MKMEVGVGRGEVGWRLEFGGKSVGGGSWRVKCSRNFAAAGLHCVGQLISTCTVR